MANIIITRDSQLKRRRTRVRYKLSSENIKTRLTISKSNKYLYAQLIDLSTGKTIAGVKSKDAKKAGEEIAKKAKLKKINRVIFDRGGYTYHGQVKTLAEAAREGGLAF